jgi:thiol-disulfide isomerase/thioredoxin
MLQPRPWARTLLSIALLVGACAGSSSSPPIGGVGPGSPAAVSSAPTAAPVAPTTPSSLAPADAPDTPPATRDVGAGPLTQAWATAILTDVSTGETFRVADLADTVVILETMAIWCSNCRAQQRDVQAALARLPRDKVVYVVLDVDPNEDAASLADYRVANGFEGRYAIAGDDVATALTADFGDQFLNPPLTPMLIVGTDGTVIRTDFGHKSVDEIVNLAQAHGA